jgi:hypothetical protein
MKLPFAAPALSFGQQAASGVILDLRAKDVPSATRKTLAVLRVSEMLAQQPTLISQLVAISLQGIGQAVTWEILQSSQVDDDELKNIQNAWSHLSSGNAASSYRFERATAVDLMQSPATSILKTISSSHPSSASAGGNLWIQTVAYLWSVFCRPADMSTLIRNYQMLIDALPMTNSSTGWQEAFEVSDRIKATLPTLNRSHIITKLSLPAVLGTERRFAGAEISRTLTVTAIAIERYRLAHSGSLPSTLQVLVPEFLPEIPKDPMDGEPLRYKREGEDSFLLYSVGYDGVDDGGNPEKPAGSKSRELTQMK